LHQSGTFVKFHPMLELEVHAAGLRDLNKILELDYQLDAIPGVRYRVDRNYDLVYLELDQPMSIPPELRPNTKTQSLSV
jgi:hypothetical protein